MLGYVTIEEATTYVSSHYVSTNSLRKNWESLSDEDKQVLLNVSAEAINNLPFPGRKTSLDQENAFPRYPSKDVPTNIKYAQVENAIAMTDESETSTIDKYNRMRAYGISSYSIGNLSESIGSVQGVSASQLLMIESGIVSTKAQSLLIGFLKGGYCIE